jgi:protoporphyrinogen oxidase
MNIPPKSKTAVIIGGGPAGLTAALELLRYTDVKPIVLESLDQVGGISRTINYKGYRMDIGGHRFFSKSDRVMNWWRDIMPIQKSDDPAAEVAISYQGSKRKVELDRPAPDPAATDLVMLIRNRISRIFYLRSFFKYPISLDIQTLKNLGPVRVVRIGFSYLFARISPIRQERTLQDFLINRFGRELFSTFFEDYTHKVWGRPCSEISAEWGAQRIKGLSIKKVLSHAISTLLGKNKQAGIGQKKVETSLIERFLYPKLGPGQLWEEVARQVDEKGGQVLLSRTAVALHIENLTATSVKVRNLKDDSEETLQADYVISTMPMRNLFQVIQPAPPSDIQSIAQALVYRDFITIGILVNKMALGTPNEYGIPMAPDNWIYIQERDVKIGRLQIFNNWSPYLVADPTKVWMGLEYFCNEGDELWSKSDTDLVALGISELSKIGLIHDRDVLDSTVVRVEKAYPAYFGGYEQIDRLREYVDPIPNLFLVGRNGMHRYNNQDHSMLSAMTVVENIRDGVTDKNNIWNVNTEKEYHESK